MSDQTNPVQALSAQNLETVLKSFEAMTKGVQAVAAEIVDYNTASLNRGTACFQELTGAKNIGQAMDIQTAYMRSFYEGFVTEMGKLGELWTSASHPMIGQPHPLPKRAARA